MTLACASQALIITDSTPGRQVARAPSSFALRGEGYEYLVTFRHEQASGEHFAVVSSSVRPYGEHEPQPRWLEFMLDGQRLRLEHWSHLSQAPKRTRQALTCAGVMFQRCSRAESTTDQYSWRFPIPAERVEQFANLLSGSAVIAVGDVAIHQELTDDSDWIREFFRATASTPAG